jgi:hypothetical protein
MTEYAAVLNGVEFGGDSIYRWRTPPAGLGHGTVSGDRIARPGVDGLFALGPDTLDARTITFDLYWVGETAAEVEQSSRLLAAAWTPQRVGSAALTFTVADREYVCFGRARVFELDLLYASVGHGRARCEFEATDPRLYSSVPAAVVLGLSGGTGGLEYPLSYPLSYGAGSDSDGSIDNEGTISTTWTASIVGPVSNPRLTLGATGQYIEINGEIPAGSTMVLDSLTRSVLLNGSPRQTWLTLPSRWWELAAGVNTVRFRATSGTGACTFSWRSAWL